MADLWTYIASWSVLKWVLLVLIAGFIGQFGSVMGDAGVNIATFNLGRERAGGDAIAIVAVDDRVPDGVLEKVAALPQVLRVRRLSF